MTNTPSNGIDELGEWLAGFLPETPQRVLDIGCGRAEFMERWAGRVPSCDFVGLDIDRQQLCKNVADPQLGRINFFLASALSVPFSDSCFDVVLMNKSLHHLAIESMLSALVESHRVLRDGGLLAIVEPVYAGSFNEVLRVFHDEREQRRAALAAIDQAVTAGLFSPIHSETRMCHRRFQSFEDFETRVMNVTHTDFGLTAQKIAAARAAFHRFAEPSGAAVLEGPIRLEILRAT